MLSRRATYRLVASELERRWNEALQVVHRLEGEIAELEAKQPAPLGEKERMTTTQSAGGTTKPFVSWLCLTISTLCAGTVATAASACRAL
jgi:hypothetical protein